MNLNISQNSKYVCICFNITISPGQMIPRKDLWGKALGQKKATFSLMRNPLSFVCSSPSSEQLSWQSFWPKVLKPLKSLSPRPIYHQTHIRSHCRFPALLSLPRSPERQDIETNISMMRTIAYLLDWTSLNWGYRGRFSSTKVNCSF